MSMTTQGTPVTLASSITYMPFGGIASLTYGNSLSLTQTWDNQYRLSSITAGSVLSLSYGYDASGNVTSITDTIGSAPGQYIDSTTYAYESGTNRLTTITGTPTATLTHDANGNIITEGTRTFTYDLTNRLTAVTDNETEIASYVYDARNLRVKKATPAETRIFHYDVNGHLIAETDTAGNTLVEYVYLSDMPLATVRPTDTVYYFHTDHINTPRVMTNSAGTVAWQAAYHGFGHAEVDGASTITNNIRFPGQYFDAETNLHYNWNRYYDPRTGRYLTPDPIGLEGGIDPFVYAENSPVNWVDIAGLKGDWRLDLYDHDMDVGKRPGQRPHFTSPEGHRYDARTLEPIAHKKMPPELTKSQKKDLCKSKAFDKWIKYARKEGILPAAFGLPDTVTNYCRQYPEDCIELFYRKD